MTDHVKNIKEALALLESSFSIGTARDQFQALNIFESRCTVEAITALLGELEEAKKDAERYRWLRNEAINHGNDDGTPTAWCVLGQDYQDTRPAQGAELDAAIDAAIKGATP